MRRVQLELENTRGDVATLEANAQNQTTAPAVTLPTTPASTTTPVPIINLIRNGDHNHSLDTWFNETGTGLPPALGTPGIVGGTF